MVAFRYATACFNVYSISSMAETVNIIVHYSLDFLFFTSKQLICLEISNTPMKISTLLMHIDRSHT